MDNKKYILSELYNFYNTEYYCDYWVIKDSNGIPQIKI